MIDNQYSLIELIGLGGSSRVYKARDIHNNECAIKVIRPEKEYTPVMAAFMVDKEYNHLKMLEGHPNLIKGYDMNLRGVCQIRDSSEACMYSVLEYCKNGSLSRYVKFTGAFEEEVARFFMVQILSAVHHIHSNKHAHLDIKLDNILLDEFYNIKVADLGSASDVSTLNGYTPYRRGTPKYMAPEVIRLDKEEEYDAYAADIYSLGVTLFVMLTGEFPTKSNIGNNSTIETNSCSEEENMNDKTKPNEDRHSYLSEEVRDLLHSMTEDEDIARPLASEILVDSWLSRPFHPKIQEFVFQEMESRKNYIDEMKASISHPFSL